MKVLTATWTIYDDRIEEFKNNRTGGGLIIKNLCEGLGKRIDSFLIIWETDLPDMELGHIHIVKNYCDAKVLQSDDKQKVTEDRKRVRLGAFKRALDDIKPDIVSFQGISEISMQCMSLCDKKKVKYVYTEHLFVRRDKEYSGYDITLKWQQRLYNKEKLNIIAISNGMKKSIMHDFPELSDESIKVICNGTDFIAEKRESDIQNRFHLEGKKVLICAGSICKRKNQLAVVDGYGLIDPAIRDDIVVLFLGNDRLNGELEKVIMQHGCEHNLMYVGAVSSEEMKEYYSIAQGLVMPSMGEGLSIAALEMLAYGKPVIMFQDSECAEDLGDGEVSVLAKERTSNSLAEAIEEWYVRKWNSQYIENFSKKFTMDRVVEEYLRYYGDLIKMLSGQC